MAAGDDLKISVAVLNSEMVGVKDQLCDLWTHKNDMSEKINKLEQGMAKFKGMLAVWTAVGSILGGVIVAVVSKYLLK